MVVGALCRAGVNLFQINSQVVGGEYAAPLLLGISKRSLLEGRASTPAYAVYTGWHADTMFSLVPSKTQVAPHTATSASCTVRRTKLVWACPTQVCSGNVLAWRPGLEHKELDNICSGSSGSTSHRGSPSSFEWRVWL